MGKGIWEAEEVVVKCTWRKGKNIFKKKICSGQSRGTGGRKKVIISVVVEIIESIVVRLESWVREVKIKIIYCRQQ